MTDEEEREQLEMVRRWAEKHDMEMITEEPEGWELRGDIDE